MDELDLVNKVELRLLLADSDEALTKSLDIFLCPLLEKLKSPRQDVISKIVSVLGQVSRRITPGVELPKSKLVALWLNSARSKDIATLRQNTQLLKFLRVSLLSGSPGPYTDALAAGISIPDFGQNEYLSKQVSEQFALFLICLTDCDLQTHTLQVVPEDAAALSKILAGYLYAVQRGASALSSPDSGFYAPALAVGSGPNNGNNSNLVTRSKVVELSLQNRQTYRTVLLAATADRSEQLSAKAVRAVDEIVFDPSELLEAVFNSSGSRNASAEVAKAALGALARQYIPLDSDAAERAVQRALELGDPKVHSAVLKWLQFTIDSAQDRRKAYSSLLQRFIMDHGATPQNGLAFELIGKLQAGGDSLEFLLRSLENGADVQRGVTAALNGSTDPEAAGIQLFNHLRKGAGSQPLARVAVHFASRRLNSVLGHLICLLAFGTGLVEEPLKALEGQPLPFEEMLTAISSVWPPPPLLHNHQYSRQASEMLTYLGRCLGATAGGLDHQNALSTHVGTRQRVQMYASAHAELCSQFLSLCMDAFKRDLIQPDRLVLWQPLVSLMPVAALSEKSQLLELINVSGVYAAVDELVMLPELSVDAEMIMNLIQGGHQHSAAQILACTALRGMSVDNSMVKAIIRSTPNDQTVLGLLILGGLVSEALVPSELSNWLSQANSHLAIVIIACMRLSDSKNMDKYITEVLQRHPDRSDMQQLVLHGQAVAALISGFGGPESILRRLFPSLPLPDMSNDIVEVAWSRVYEPDSSLTRELSIRLLCLVEYSWTDLSRHNKVSEIRSALFGMLESSSKDDLVQEAAILALAIIYDRGSATERQTLVDDLKALLRESNTRLSAGSENLKVYRAVLSLATDAGDPGLVYSLMPLAVESPLWRHPAATVFMLENSAFAARITADIDQGTRRGHRLVPQLFRRISDPNPRIQHAMQSIWKTVAIKPAAILQQYVPGVLQQLLASAGAHEGRVRVSSALALADLISSRPSSGDQGESLSEWAPQVWRIALRLEDDIETHVRDAGSELAKALTRILLRRLENHVDVPEVHDVVEHLLGPQGIQQRSEEVQGRSMDMLLQIVRVAPVSIALDVLTGLCLQMSSLEPAALNYIELNAENFGVDPGAVDQSRARALRTSPVMTALEGIVERVKGAELRQLVEINLPEVVRQSVGVPSQLAAARLTSLASLRPVAHANFGPLLLACASRFWGLNTPAYAFTEAWAQVARHAPLPDILKVLNRLRTAMTSDDDAKKETTSRVLDALSRNSSDRFAELTSMTLPLAFVGKCGQGTYAEIFQRVWSNNTSGNAVLKLYRTEIIALAEQLLGATVLSSRLAGAHALLDLVTQDHQPDLDLLGILDAALKPRTWPGKEAVFQAFVEVVVATQVSDKVVESVLRELNRRNPSYKLGILASTAKISASSGSRELAEALVTATAEVLTLQSDDEETGSISQLDAKVDAFRAVVSTSPPGWMQFFTVDGVAWSHWKFRETACGVLASLGAQGTFDREVWSNATKFCARDDGQESVRIAWAQAANSLLSRDEVVKKDIINVASTEKSVSVRSELRKSGLIG